MQCPGPRLSPWQQSPQNTLNGCGFCLVSDGFYSGHVPFSYLSLCLGSLLLILEESPGHFIFWEPALNHPPWCPRPETGASKVPWARATDCVAFTRFFFYRSNSPGQLSSLRALLSFDCISRAQDIAGAQAAQKVPKIRGFAPKGKIKVTGWPEPILSSFPQADLGEQMLNQCR